jgi:soluble lytic murein transglycosylase
LWSPALPEPASEETWSPSRVELSAEAAFYDELGLLEDAATALRRGESAARDAAGLRAVVQEYARLADFERAYRLTASHDDLRRPASGGALWAWRAAYPLAFESSVRDGARTSGIEPALVWAVMRQESAFDPVVVSVSDAIGLMQMLPATGTRTAAGLGLPFRREDLFDPATNVRLGTAYLAALVEEFGAPLAFAAYNAGEHRVRQWLIGRECEDLDRFVDTIPFEQTRNYTRRVAGNVARYTALEAGGTGGWPAAGLTEPAGGARCVPDPAPAP